MKQLTIGKPYVKSEHGKSRLEAVISSENFEKPLYYEVEEKYGEYLCPERADAFVLETVVKNCRGLFKPIQVLAKTEGKAIENVGGAGASVSGGVDSFYTIVSNLGKKTKD